VSQRRRVSRLVALALAAAAAACSSSQSAQRENSDRNTAAKGGDAIALALQRCPLWAVIPAGDLETRAHITDAYLRLAHYPTAAIRAGIVLYLQSFPARDPHVLNAQQRVFALLRVVFQVPARVDPNKGLPYGVYGNPALPDGTIDFLWPFSAGSAGQLELTGVDQGAHAGPAPNVLSDFDRMASQLPRRFPATR